MEILRHNFSKQRESFLKSRGVDYPSFLTKTQQIDLENCFVRISTEIKGVVTKSISVNRQLKAFDKLLLKPLSNPMTIGIGSYPTDLKARQMAVSLINRMMDQQLTTKSRALRSKSAPLWYRVYGGFNCPIRDKNDHDYPCALFLTNVCIDSTAPKIEKVRDLLDKFSDVVRVVVIAGQDPLTFFANQLHYPLDLGFYLGPETRYRDL